MSAKHTFLLFVMSYLRAFNTTSVSTVAQARRVPEETFVPPNLATDPLDPEVAAWDFVLWSTQMGPKPLWMPEALRA